MNFWHDLPRPFFVLAPMEAVTDVVFRHVIKQAGPPDVFFTEFTNATGWVHAGDPAIGGRLVKTDDENPIVAQIWGAVPDDFAQIAQYCKTLGYHGIDINMGCPDASAVKAGGGAGMIRTPDLASEVITAAKTAGLPVSVKTRLGYSKTDEMKEWLAHLLRQDIVNLTIHLRTKKEMSKVPAHHELIPDILVLRDKIAPNTLITINGDIENRAEGLALTKKYPGIDGIMIGRGIFHNPFAFSQTPLPPSSPSSSEGVTRPMSLQQESGDNEAALRFDPHSEEVTREGVASVNAEVQAADGEPLGNEFSKTSAAQVSAAAYATETWREAVLENSVDKKASKTKLINLLHLHLDLFDQWDTPEHPRKFDPLKRFFKIYVNSFEGAAELRDKLMHTKNTAEVRSVLEKNKL